MNKKLLISTMINKWLENTVIALDLCPYALKPLRQGKVLIKELAAHESSQAQINFLDSLSSFQSQNKFETALLVYPQWQASFADFYDFLQDCEDLLISLQLQDEFQLVAFHPHFCFAGLEFENPANLVNSSPLPLLHLLRKIDLDVLGLSPQQAQEMSYSNGRKLQSLTPEQLAQHFPWRSRHEM